MWPTLVMSSSCACTTMHKSEQVCLGEDGLLGHLSPGSILINHTTCDPNTMRLLDEQAEPTGVGVVDAALSGSPADIGEGHLTLWVGGGSDLLQSDRSDHRGRTPTR